MREGGRKYASFLVEFKDLAELIQRPLSLEMRVFETLDSILSSTNVHLHISIDTEGFSQVEEAILLYDNTSSEISKYRKHHIVKLNPLQ